MTLSFMQGIWTDIFKDSSLFFKSTNSLWICKLMSNLFAKLSSFKLLVVHKNLSVFKDKFFVSKILNFLKYWLSKISSVDIKFYIGILSVQLHNQSTIIQQRPYNKELNLLKLWSSKVHTQNKRNPTQNRRTKKNKEDSFVNKNHWFPYNCLLLFKQSAKVICIKSTVEDERKESFFFVLNINNISIFVRSF